MCAPRVPHGRLTHTIASRCYHTALAARPKRQQDEYFRSGLQGLLLWVCPLSPLNPSSPLTQQSAIATAASGTAADSIIPHRANPLQVSAVSTVRDLFYGRIQADDIRYTTRSTQPDRSFIRHLNRSPQSHRSIRQILLRQRSAIRSTPQVSIQVRPIPICRPIQANRSSEDTLEAELSVERPNWTLSSFGAAKYEPNLFFGYDLSQEELRWKCVVALKENRAPDYVRCSSPSFATPRSPAKRRVGERGGRPPRSSEDDHFASPQQPPSNEATC